MDLKKILGLNLASGCLFLSCFGFFFMILLGFAVGQLPFGLSGIGWAWMQGRLDAVDAYNVNIVIASSYADGRCVPGGLPGDWPITQYFHDPNHNPNHAGIDFSVAVGTPIYSTIGGEVVYAGWNDQGYGNLVIVQNGPVTTYFAHLDQVIVEPGRVVVPQVLLGLSGNTGNSTGPHLHYETRVKGVPVDPLAGSFGDIICQPATAQSEPATAVEDPGTGGALSTPPVRLEGNPTTVDFRVVSAYGRYDPEPGMLYGRVMDSEGTPLAGVTAEVFWSGDGTTGNAQATTGSDGLFLFQVYEPLVSVRIAGASSQVVADLDTAAGSYELFFKATGES